jgi:hypothetical protein
MMYDVWMDDVPALSSLRITKRKFDVVNCEERAMSNEAISGQETGIIITRLLPAAPSQ